MKKIAICFMCIISLVFSMCNTSRCEEEFYQEAKVLKTLGIIEGSSKGLELDRSLNRTEAIVILARLVESSDEIVSINTECRFTDVPNWAKPYVGFMNEGGYVNGISYNTFGSSNNISANEFMTMVLRIMGYKDGVDFTWKTAVADASKLNILKEYFSNRILSSKDFNRGEAMALIYNSLFGNIKSLNCTLMEDIIINTDAITQGKLNSAAGIDSNVSLAMTRVKLALIPENGDVKNLNEIKGVLEESMVKISLSNSITDEVASGLGFLASKDGKIVTSYSIIKGMTEGTVRLYDGTELPILGVTGIDKENDVAWIKISGSNYNFMEMGSSSRISQKQKLYISEYNNYQINVSDTRVKLSSAMLAGKEQSFILTNSEYKWGTVGAPVLDVNGKVIGMNYGSVKIDNSELLVVPINRAKSILQTAPVKLTYVD